MKEKDYLKEILQIKTKKTELFGEEMELVSDENILKMKDIMSRISNDDDVEQKSIIDMPKMDTYSCEAFLEDKAVYFIRHKLPLVEFYTLEMSVVD